MSDFHDGRRPRPLAPEARPLRYVIADLDSGRLDTNTRYGRKNMWKPEQKQRYIHTLLKGHTLTDPISIGRHVEGGRTREPAVNGNNRLRSIRQFVHNQLGVKALDAEGRACTYYYSEVPAGRNRNCRVLPDDVRNAFNEYPILFNCRPDLTELEEIAWYEELNTSLHAHTSGHLLVADICKLGDFASALLTHFPAVKERISETERPEDANSLGSFLIELSGCEPDFMSEDDKRENVLLVHALLTNLLVNGGLYNDGWKGAYSAQTLAENVRDFRAVFQEARISEELHEEWSAPVKGKPYMQTFYSPNYLLAAIAWSIGTRKENAVRNWKRFLSNIRPGDIAAVYGDELARLKHADNRPEKYEFIWRCVCQYVGA